VTRKKSPSAQETADLSFQLLLRPALIMAIFMELRVPADGLIQITGFEAATAP
jgi:hypothetical protein